MNNMNEIKISIIVTKDPPVLMKALQHSHTL